MEKYFNEIEEYIKKLEFDSENHKYILDGDEIISVTQIMKPLSSYEYKDIPAHILNKAAERGTAVHEAIEFLLKYGIEEIEEDYGGYLEAYKKWANEHEIKLIGSEYKIAHKLMKYAGTVDMIAYIDGKITLVDFKTTSVLLDKIVAVQLEAYAKMLESFGVKVEQKIALQIKKDGTYKTLVFESDDKERWKIFLELYDIYNYIKKC